MANIKTVAAYSLLTLCAVSAPTSLAAAGSNSTNDVVNRTRYCIRGGLPMEVQFAIDSNPRKLAGQKLSGAAIDQLIVQLETSIASLLRNAGKSAWEKARHISPESPLFAEAIEAEISVYVVKNSARELHLTFCGDKEFVGNDIDTTILEYLGRSLDLGPNKRPEWLENMEKGKERGMSIVLSAVALRLAQADIGIDDIVKSFDN